MQQNPSFNINSKHYIDRLENDIVQLARTLSVEHSIDIEEAKLMARQITQRRINGLLTKEEKEGIENLTKEIMEIVKAPENTMRANFRIHAKKVYELLKTFELI
jgi:hypothetical protein